jgi:hypothetical protein
MHNEIKPMQFERLQCWYYRWDGFVEDTVEMASVVRYTKFHYDPFRYYYCYYILKLVPR